MEPEEKICERCHQVKRTTADTCPDDGGRLHVVSDERALIGRVIDDKLTLTDVIGKGGMGVVYRAHQHSVDRELAVKVLHPSFASDTESVRRFLHEARAATRLEHPNVITVFDFGRTEDGLLYIVMELINGRSLAREIAEGPIEPGRAVHLLTQIADAVHHAHERGLVHRDLKPDNIVLLQGSSLRGDFVKVLDFGIAMMRTYDGIERITRTGAVCGTPAYMSPEQVLGDEVDARCDVYALGVIAYEMISGIHPLPADTAMRQMLAHLESPIPRIDAVAPQVVLPKALEAAIRHAMAKKREDRPQNALIFANELVRALSGSDVGLPMLSVAASWPSAEQAVPAKRPEQKVTTNLRKVVRSGNADTARAMTAPQPSRGWRGLIPYAAILALVLGAVIFFATRSDPAEEEPVDPALAATMVPVMPTPVAEAEGASAEGDAAASSEPRAALGVDAPDDGDGPGPTDAEAADIAPRLAAGEADSTPAEAAAEAVNEAAPARSITVASSPRRATVILDGAEVGITPLEIPVPAGEATALLVVKKRGYHTRKHRLDATSQDLTVHLSRIAPKRIRSDAPPIIR